MYVQKKLRQRISAAMAVVMVLGNSVNAAAAPATGGRAASPVVVSNTGYTATIDLEKGSLLLSYNSDQSKDWNTTEGMLPGATMLMDSANVAREANMTVTGAFDNEDGSVGTAGIRMSGEVSGVKSWFLFDSGVFCLGAGLESNVEGTDKVITVVENVAVPDNKMKLAMPGPANTYALIKNADGQVANNNWKSLVDAPYKQVHTARNWMGISPDNNNNFQWHYIFNDIFKNCQVWTRFPTSDGKIISRGKHRNLYGDMV